MMLMVSFSNLFVFCLLFFIVPTVMFNPVTYTVTEGDSAVMLNITFVTSQPLLEESIIRITNIPTAGATNQATG